MFLLPRKAGVGTIVLWFGLITTIPTGYALCDGTNGTPDLRDKFVVGAGPTFSVDASGGVVAHVHTFDSGDHRHDVDPGTGLKAGIDIRARTGIDRPIGTTELTNNLPTYYSLAYIMEL